MWAWNLYAWDARQQVLARRIIKLNTFKMKRRRNAWNVDKIKMHKNLIYCKDIHVIHPQLHISHHVYSSSFPFNRDLRCLRNTIHINLFVTYILSASVWFALLAYQVSISIVIQRAWPWPDATRLDPMAMTFCKEGEIQIERKGHVQKCSWHSKRSVAFTWVSGSLAVGIVILAHRMAPKRFYCLSHSPTGEQVIVRGGLQGPRHLLQLLSGHELLLDARRRWTFMCSAGKLLHL